MTGDYIFFDLPTLKLLKADVVTCLQTILVGNQQYTMAGRTFTRANLAEVQRMAAEIGYAISVKEGNGPQRDVKVDMSCNG